MVHSLIAGLTALLIAVMVPAYLCEPVSGSEPDPYLLIVKQEKKDMAVPEIALKTEHGIEVLPLETYLTGVVISEMPASFEMDALKAQAVAARTFTMRQLEQGKHDDCDLCSDSRCCQAWTGTENIRKKLGDSYELYWRKVETAVSETNGEVLCYDGKLIEAVYFSCSGGVTEDAVAVWGGDVPYLKSVESPGEENAGPFSSTVTVPVPEFRQKILKSNPDANLDDTAAGWFDHVERSSGGGVITIRIGGVLFTGTQIRNLFGLRSTNFEVSVTEDGIRFSVRGYGHRVGMSQYGANAMAKAGSDYREILTHYYTGVEIEKRP